MALFMTRAFSFAKPQARQFIVVCANRIPSANSLPCTTQVAHLTSTGGKPAKRKHAPWPYETRPYNSMFQFIDHTRKRLDDNSKIILVEGNIGVGKSWFAEQIAKEFDMKFVPDIKDSKIFITGDKFDMRTLNERLPPRSGFCDMETFYSQRGPPDLLKTFPRTLLMLYYHHFHYYARALEHVLNTGNNH
jgi:NADH dehydrogenase (ubiquinone) 1 alpha subcomplex subunit 10